MPLRRTSGNRLIVAAILVLAFALVLIVWLAGRIIGGYAQFTIEDPTEAENLMIPVGLVLGAGITEDGWPKPVLRSRLDAAADGYAAGHVRRLLVSGDNRFDSYNEPGAMKRYLVEQRGVASDDIQEDFAGRSTYESCERASKVFELDSVIIYTTKSHLARAIYLCRHFGIDAFGVPSRLEANNADRREPLARIKALFNVHILGEPTVLGEQIPLR